MATSLQLPVEGEPTMYTRAANLLTVLLVCLLIAAVAGVGRPLSAQAAPSPGPGTPIAPSSSAPPPGFAGMIGVFFAFYFVIILVAIIFGIGGLILSCLAIYDCARRDFPDPNTRAMWCLLIALLRLIGTIVYYFVVYRKNDPPLQQARIPGAPPPSPMSGYGG